MAASNYPDSIPVADFIPTSPLLRLICVQRQEEASGPVITSISFFLLFTHPSQRRDQIRIDGPFILSVRSAVDIIGLDLELR